MAQVELESLDRASQEWTRRDVLASKLANMITDWARSPEYREIKEVYIKIRGEYPMIFHFGSDGSGKKFLFAPLPENAFAPFDGVEQKLVSNHKFARLWLGCSRFSQSPEEAFADLQKAVRRAVQKSVHQFRMEYDLEYKKKQVELLNEQYYKREAVARKKLWKNFGWISFWIVVVGCSVWMVLS